MTLDADQQSKDNPKNLKTSIMSIFHNLFKPGISTQLLIRNMILKDIPTQVTRIYIRLKQGRSRQSTQLVKIIGNTAAWSDQILIDVRVPNASNGTSNSSTSSGPSRTSNATHERGKRSFSLRFSFRLEDISGRGHTRYGYAELNLASITMVNDWEYQAVLQDCNYESNFSCLISVMVMKEMTQNDPNSRGLVHESYSFDVLSKQQRKLSLASNSGKKKHSRHKNDYNNNNSNNDQKKDATNNQSMLIQPQTTIPEVYASCFEGYHNDVLPFKIQQVKLDVLTKQVDDIISDVIYSLSQK